jgi:hypothetical protein
MRVDTVKAQQSHVIRADPDRVWQLLQRPSIWSMRATAFMFAVPGADQLRFWVGSTSRGLPSSGLYELTVDEDARSVTYQAPAPSRHYSRLSMRTVRRGVKVHAETVTQAPRVRASAAELDAYAGLDRWLDRVGAVAEGRRPEPGDTITPDVVELCLRAPPQPKDWLSVSAEILIAAGPAAVWAAVHEPHQDPSTDTIPVAFGIVPGTPVGQRGEIQYFIFRRSDGSLTSQAAAVSALAGMDAVTHRLRPPYDQTRYHASAQGSGTRLQISWSGPAPSTAADTVAASLRALLEHHKSELEKSHPGKAPLASG